jgi:hypothetical protein
MMERMRRSQEIVTVTALGAGREKTRRTACARLVR